MRRSRTVVVGALLLLLTLVSAACQTTEKSTTTATPKSKGTVTVGVSGSFAENQIVAEMYAQVLEKAGYTVKRQLSLQNREVSEPALESGQIDLKPEYLGSLLLFLDPKASASSDPSATIGPLRTALAAKKLTALDYSPANDTNAFVVTKATADKYQLKTVSDLKPVASQLTLAGPPECEQRPFCAIGLKDTYGVVFKTIEKTGACDSATANVLDAGKADVALLCSTQSIIAKKGWIPLVDDKHLQKADNLVPVVRNAVLNDEIAKLLNSVSSKLTTDGLTALNSKVEIDQQDPADVAKQFLKDQKLI